MPVILPVLEPRFIAFFSTWRYEVSVRFRQGVDMKDPAEAGSCNANQSRRPPCDGRLTEHPYRCLSPSILLDRCGDEAEHIDIEENTRRRVKEAVLAYADDNAIIANLLRKHIGERHESRWWWR